MTKHYNTEEFSCKIGGVTYTFTAYTTNTKSGFCHTVISNDMNVSPVKVSYSNRTWESFRYETVLRRMIKKYPQAMREEMTRQLIDGEAAKEEEKANALFDSFKRLHDGLSDENKKRLQNLPPMQSEGDARAVMGLMGLMTLMQG